MKDKHIYEKLLEKILMEPRQSHSYRRALESVHMIRLHETTELKISLEQDGGSIYLAAQIKGDKKREYAPKELTDIIIKSEDYKEGRITPGKIIENFTENISYPLGNTSVRPFRDYLANNDR